MRMQPVSPSTHWCTNPFQIFHSTQAIQRTNIHKTTPKKCVTHVYSPALLSHTLNLLTLSSLRCKHAAAPRQNAPPPRWRTPFLWQWEQASQQYTAQGWGQIPHWDLHTLTNTPRSHIPRGVTPRSAIHNTQGTDLSGTGARYRRETAVILRQTNWNNKWAELHKFDACMLMQVTSWISNMFNQWMRHQRHIIFFGENLSTDWKGDGNKPPVPTDGLQTCHLMFLGVLHYSLCCGFKRIPQCCLHPSWRDSGSLLPPRFRLPSCYQLHSVEHWMAKAVKCWDRFPPAAIFSASGNTWCSRNWNITALMNNKHFDPNNIRNTTQEPRSDFSSTFVLNCIL